MDFFLKKKILYSHELCAFISFNLQDKRRLLLMREHYLSIRPIDGKRKFNNSVKYIEEEYNVDLSLLKVTI